MKSNSSKSFYYILLLASWSFIILGAYFVFSHFLNYDFTFAILSVLLFLFFSIFLFLVFQSFFSHKEFINEVSKKSEVIKRILQQREKEEEEREKEEEEKRRKKQREFL